MRTTINIDDAILDRARRYCGDIKTGELVERALQALIAGEAADRLAALGGSEPDAWVAQRRESPKVAEDAAVYEVTKNSPQKKS